MLLSYYTDLKNEFDELEDYRADMNDMIEENYSNLNFTIAPKLVTKK